jgi:hypothetical protein
MAKEVKSNFGSHQTKNKAGEKGPSSAEGGGSVGMNSSNWGIGGGIIPPVASNNHPELIHNNSAAITNPMSISTPNCLDIKSNDSSVQSNSNSEFSDGVEPPGQAPILRQRQNPQKQSFQFAQEEFDDPYGPMAGHFYNPNAGRSTGRPVITNSESDEVLTSPVINQAIDPNRSCAYHPITRPSNSSQMQILSGSSADVNRPQPGNNYGPVKYINRQFQSGTNLHRPV